ncbi:probable disease resistance protein At1g58602 [Salvia hispanica]|uniref:probable disease resistance protein At1g58602 n=1 Tax=Salvia hispanica TaxID=49212 RepID=UPI002009C45B|nr:probable disease resistance protein At1g58602 [Salvia hispanica]XP_047956478.1 probable disease resistance protein At1g58602 [Salvia hispanica]XP_047956479.1 probable disease resistance protein At1g58602 [Salvia hispanica]XP_047956480.1 probable disease resistance protein At1g58602 [Salvia hispanica]
MAEAVILSMIEKLENCPVNRDNIIHISGPIKWIISELRHIVDLVRNKKFGEGRRLSFLVSDLVHMAHDALDLHKKGKTSELYFIARWIGEIKMRMSKLGVDGAETESNSEDHAVLGLDKHIEMVLRTIIVYTKEYRPLVLIKGMAGIGKTTLAREIYNHADVIERFEYRAWVCVSNVTTLKDLIIKLLQHAVVDVDGDNLHTLEEMDNQSLLSMLHRHMRGQPYLIVLDDLPKQIYFRPIWKALKKEVSDGSKLVVTSHMMHGFLKNKLHDVYKMEPLDSIMSWQLFYKTINSGNKLRNEQKFPKELEYQGKLMLRKCGGLPLAIKEVANQLAQKKASTGSEWEQLLECVDFGSTLELLEPYYKKLDTRLLLCFMYMALYKENTTLRANKLTQIWYAAGEMARSHSYIEGLIDESVIDEINDKSTRYRMNPVLHRLSIKKAEKGIGFEILGSNRLNGNPRHRVIICSRDNFSYSMNQNNYYLVSLFFHGGGYFNASPTYWKGFEKLKILDFEDFGLKIVPETIGILTKLSYLGLRNNYIKELPKSVGCLKNLEVLDIAQNFMVHVPDIIWEMGSLVHLYMSDVICKKPFKIDVLQRLETLTSVSVDNLLYELSGFKMLTYLAKLGVQDLDGNTHVSKLFVLLSNFKFLEHLILRGYRFKSMSCLVELGTLKYVKTLKLDGRLDRLPNSFPCQMASLTLANSCLDEDPMPLLGKLSQLRNLILRNAFTGQRMGIFKGDFPILQVLCMEELRHLRNLQIEKGALDYVHKLEIHNCPYLDTLPEEVRSMHRLEELKMETTKTISTNIKNSHSISEIRFVNINP